MIRRAVWSLQRLLRRENWTKIRLRQRRQWRAGASVGKLGDTDADDEALLAGAPRHQRMLNRQQLTDGSLRPTPLLVADPSCQETVVPSVMRG